eukprot:m51a1_g14158 putative leucine-rich repeat receptor-like protein kinase family (665) ;mRNA; f:48949-55917
MAARAVLAGRLAAAAPAEEVQALCDWHASTSVSATYSEWPDPCNWTSPCATQLHGVRCSGGTVVELYGHVPSSPEQRGAFSAARRRALGNTDLAGTIPPSTALLGSLRFLDLRRNRLSGTIPPSIGGLAMLTLLRLERNRISGSIPPTIGNLTRLSSLVLFSNSLGGSIPPSVGELSQLSDLHLEQNNISGTIPETIGQLGQLIQLDLFLNQLSGTIPACIGNLTHLSTLNLSHNQLSGTLPPSIDRLGDLLELGVGNNRLAGRVPQGQFYCGPEVAIMGSKSSGRYRIQSDDFGAMWVIVSSFAQRLAEHFKAAAAAAATADAEPFYISYQEKTLPFNEYFEVRLKNDIMQLFDRLGQGNRFRSAPPMVRINLLVDWSLSFTDPAGSFYCGTTPEQRRAAAAVAGASDSAVYVCDLHTARSSEFAANGGAFPPHNVIARDLALVQPALAPGATASCELACEIALALQGRRAAAVVPRHVYYQDWGADPASPPSPAFTWRHVSDTFGGVPMLQSAGDFTGRADSPVTLLISGKHMYNGASVQCATSLGIADADDDGSAAACGGDRVAAEDNALSLLHRRYGHGQGLEIAVTGVVTGICVFQTASNAKQMLPRARVCIIRDACTHYLGKCMPDEAAADAVLCGMCSLVDVEYITASEYLRTKQPQ